MLEKRQSNIINTNKENKRIIINKRGNKILDINNSIKNNSNLVNNQIINNIDINRLNAKNKFKGKIRKTYKITPFIFLSTSIKIKKCPIFPIVNHLI